MSTDTIKKIEIPVSEVVEYGKQLGYTDIKIKKSQGGVSVEGKRQIYDGIETVNLCMVYKLHNIVFTD